MRNAAQRMIGIHQTTEAMMAEDVIGTMRAVVHDRFGEPGQVLRLDRSLPVLAPGPGEVLVRTSFSPVHRGDIAIVAGGGDGARLPQPASTWIRGRRRC